jgi:hypothetical protein
MLAAILSALVQGRATTPPLPRHRHPPAAWGYILNASLEKFPVCLLTPVPGVPLRHADDVFFSGYGIRRGSAGVYLEPCGGSGGNGGHRHLSVARPPT